MARGHVADVLEPGHPLRIVKFVACDWSAVRSRPAGAIRLRRRFSPRGRMTLVKEPCAYLDHFWSTADIEIEVRLRKDDGR